MTENNSAELKDEFIKYFEVTIFKTQQSSAEIVVDFTKSWFTEDCFFLTGSSHFYQNGLDEVLAIIQY